MGLLAKTFGWAAVGVGLVATWQFATSSALISTSQFALGVGICGALIAGGGYLAGSDTKSSPAPT